MALQPTTPIAVALAAAATLPTALGQDAHVFFGGRFADAPPLAAGPGTAANNLGSGVPSVIFSNLPGTASAAVPGLVGVEFEPGLQTNHFDRVYGHPSGHWVLTALADLPSSRNECLLMNGALVIQEGDAAPWIGGAENCGTLDTRCSVNAMGDVAFATNTSGTVADDFVATRVGGVWGYGAREGDAVPGGNGALLDDAIDTPVLLDDGSVGYAADGLDGSAQTDVDDDVIVLAGQVLMRKGITAPLGQLSGGTATMQNFDLGDFWTSSDGQHWLVQGDLDGSTSSDDVVVVDGAVVLQEGYPVPNSGFSEPVDSNGIKGVSMDAAGHWYARGDNDQTHQDWVVRDGQLLAVTGGVAMADSAEVWSDARLDGGFFAHVGNAGGDYVVGGMTDHGDPALDAVLVLNNTQLVARESDPVDLDGNGLADDGVYIDSFGDDDLFLTDERILLAVVTLKDNSGTRVGQALVRFAIRSRVGTQYCDVVPNSLGQAASLEAFGSSVVTDNDLTLVASGMPPTSNVLFMVAPARGLTGNLGGSPSVLCLGGAIARFVGPGQVTPADAQGEACLIVDLQSIPVGNSAGFSAVVAGDTHRFQCWYRDTAAGGASTSNMTSAVEILFE